MFWRKALIYKETVIIGLLIAYLSLVKEPVLRLPEDVAFADKWGHMLAYLLLGAMLAVNLLRDDKKMKTLLLVGLIVPVAYGGLLELLQGAFCYPRTASWFDWLADIIGTIIGVSVIAGIWSWRRSNM